MTKQLHAAIAEQAYFLWLNEGMNHGKAEHHWIMAERLLNAEAPTVAKPKAKKAAAKSAPRASKTRADRIALHS